MMKNEDCPSYLRLRGGGVVFFSFGFFFFFLACHDISMDFLEGGSLGGIFPGLGTPGFGFVSS